MRQNFYRVVRDELRTAEFYGADSRLLPALRSRRYLLYAGRPSWVGNTNNLEKVMQARSEYEIVQDQLASLLQRRCDLLAINQPVPPELEDEIEELNKDLEYLTRA